jgi:ribosomal protein S18 acetylase RimI-like enzyme
MKVFISKPDKRLLTQFEVLTRPCFPKQDLKGTFFDNRYVAWVMDEENRMVSCGTLTGTIFSNEMTLWNLCTLPQWRGKGYARALLKAVIRYLQEKEPYVSELILLVEPHNETAVRLYRLFGFVRQGLVRYGGYDVDRYSLRLREQRMCCVS